MGQAFLESKERGVGPVTPYPSSKGFFAKNISHDLSVLTGGGNSCQKYCCGIYTQRRPRSLVVRVREGGEITEFSRHDLGKSRKLLLTALSKKWRTGVSSGKKWLKFRLINDISRVR